MAQAARHNLRMQKELKLLLSDPPPGASFPLLSADSDLFSLSTIDAQIEGPEGTVYTNGIFNIRIQIPERYPFQPPSVTFATPIYHPNIDNGGRICLDILNLPPKGAWQPSLNISTVLTSIGLLLCEPNPDDGLMCEASREYKYNRQAFDQKARSMTEKYAKAGDSGISFRSQCTQTHSNPSMVEVNGLEKQAEDVIDDPVSSTNKLYEVSQDLMFHSPASNQRMGRENEEESMVLNYPLSYSQHWMEIEGKRKEVKEAIPEYNLDHKKQFLTKRNLSLHSSAPCRKRECNKETVALHQSPACSLNLNSLASFEGINSHEQPRHEHQNNGLTYRKRMGLEKLCQVGKKQSTGSAYLCQTGDGNNEKILYSSSSPSPSPSASHFSASGGGLPATMSINHNELFPEDTPIDRMGSGSFNWKFSEICPVSRKLSLGLESSLARPENGDRENLVPILKLPTPNLQTAPTKSGNGRKLSLGSMTSLQGSDNPDIEQVSYSPNCMDTCNSLSMQHHCWFDGKEQSNLNNGKTDGGIQEQAIEESSITRELIVVDSEESEEEDVRGSSRLKLSLVRKRMGKRRASA